MDVVAGHDDDVASADEMGEPVRAPAGSGLNLTPRPAPVIHGRRGTNTRKWPWFAVLILIIGGIGFVISHAISDATLFFLNADEAVAKRDELGTKPFRLQGTVVPESTVRTASGVSFRVTFNNVEVPVNHIGDPPELFRPDIPVVLQGHWVGAGPAAAFDSELILVKHSENYDAKNPDRVKEAEQGGQTSGSVPTGGAATPVKP